MAKLFILPAILLLFVSVLFVGALTKPRAAKAGYYGSRTYYYPSYSHKSYGYPSYYKSYSYPSYNKSHKGYGHYRSMPYGHQYNKFYGHYKPYGGYVTYMPYYGGYYGGWR